jgi:peptidoglycan L-alanyl-D-glutamate endopeptidase CwlK
MHLKTASLPLQDLFNTVILHRDCSVLCGHRGKEQQQAAFHDGKSEVEWPLSQHNNMPSRAVDVVPYPVDWYDINAFYEFGGFVLGIATAMNIKVRWGGHFKSFFDGPHYEEIRK